MIFALRPQGYMMKFHTLTALFLTSTLAISTHAATTTIYKSIGKNGEVRYTQLRPNDASKYEVIEMRSDGRQASAGQHAQLPTEQAPATNSDSQRLAELEKQVKEQQAQELARHCQTMRANLANLSTGGRIYETNANGERVYLNDQEISSKKQRTLETINKHCK